MDDNVQRSSSLKFKMASSYRSRCMCCVLETNLTRKFAVDLSLSLSKDKMKHSSRQFGDKFSGFGRQSKKFSRIGACIRRNFTPWLGTFILIYHQLLLINFQDYTKKQEGRI